MRKYAIRVLLFVSIFAMLFTYVQGVLTYKYSGDGANSIYDFSELEKNSIDVLFLGPSTMVSGVSPLKLYSDTGICSWNLGTSTQKVEGSYFLYEYALRTQKPLIVVLDCGTLFSQEDKDLNAAWRYILDSMPLCMPKIHMAIDYNRFWYGDGVVAGVLPIIKYHTRWSNLSEHDFSILVGEKMYFPAGTYLTSVVSASNNTPSQVDQLSEMYYMSSLNFPVIRDEELKTLLKLNSLCEENGAELVLTKIPTCINPQDSDSSWNDCKYKYIRELASEYDIPFFDLQYDGNINIDFTQDTTDKGRHLNVRGVIKVTDAIEQYLVNNYVLPAKSYELFDNMLSNYNKLCEITYLQSEMNLSNYISLIESNLDNITVIIASADEYTCGLTSELYSQFESLGLNKIRNGKYRDAYLAVIDKGQVLFEDVGEENIQCNIDLGDVKLESLSAGWNKDCTCSIKLNGVERARGTRGLNVVVYDNELKMVVDMATFDTYQSNCQCQRNWSDIISNLSKIKTYIRNQEI